jgi:L-asparaginase II
MEPLVPLTRVTRGGIVESLHLGAVAVVDAHGRLAASAGDPDWVAYLRSTAKPLQALPLLECGAADAFGFGDCEIAIACGSHSGSDAHAARVRAMLARAGLDEGALRCGTHLPGDRAARAQLRATDGAPAPAQHNCSGKHSGMLAGAVHRGATTADYLDPQHPVQQAILAALCEMGGLVREQVAVAVDGCSAPTFAISLRHTALAFARLMDPRGLPEARQAACRRIVAAMQACPVMVAGEGELDTVVMQALPGKVIIKGGAEGYCGIGIAPGARGADSPALGVAFKIVDGNGERARGPATVEILRQLGLFAEVPETLRAFHSAPVRNFREILVGEIQPAVRLNA